MQKHDNQYYRNYFKAGSKFIAYCKGESLDGITYEVINVYNYSDVCDAPLFELKAVDSKTINEREQELLKFKSKNPMSKLAQETTVDDLCTITDAEPLWFDNRTIKLI